MLRLNLPAQDISRPAASPLASRIPDQDTPAPLLQLRILLLLSVFLIGQMCNGLFRCLCLDACVTDTPTSSPVTNEDEATTEAAKIRWTITIMEPGSVAIPFKSVMADAGKLKRRHQNIVIKFYLYIIFDSNINHQHCCARALFDTYHIS